MRYSAGWGNALLRRGHIVFTSLLAVLFAIPGLAQYGVPLTDRPNPKLEAVTIRETVARYCRLDYAGARLYSADWPKLQPLVGWRTNPDYTFFMPTSRFDVNPDVVSQKGKYIVTVRYHLLGRFDMGEGYSSTATEQVEDVQYAVAEVNGDWRITDAQPNYPHPSRSATLQWFNQQLANAQEQASKTVFQDAITKLQSQKAPLTGR